MHPKNRTKLANRVIKAAEAALAAQHYAAPVDVLVGSGVVIDTLCPTVS